MQNETISVPSIHCGNCTASIEKALTALPGVTEVRSEIDNKQVHVTFDPSKVSLVKIKAAIEDEGHEVGGHEVGGHEVG